MKYSLFYVTIRELEKNKNKMETALKYKVRFLKDLQKADRQVKNGEVYTQEEVMKRLSIV